MRISRRSTMPALLLVLATSGCIHSEGRRPTLASVLSERHGLVSSTSLQFCDVPKSRIGGRLKLILPRSQALAPASQQVFLSNEKETEGSDANEDDLGVLNTPNPKGSHANERNPYMIYLRRINFADFDSTTGHPFVAVKVVLPDGADYKFDEDDDPAHWIQGVGLYQESYRNSLCVRRNQKIANPFGTRQVATFYIDLRQAFRNADDVASFEVRIVSPRSGGTRGTIDPKVYNDG